jgi:hypothetical protein
MTVPPPTFRPLPAEAVCMPAKILYPPLEVNATADRPLAVFSDGPFPINPSGRRWPSERTIESAGQVD